MTAPTTSIAWPVAEAYLQSIEVHVDGVACHPAWPGDKNVDPEMVWLQGFNCPDVSVPVMQAGRKQRAETVVLTFQVRVLPKERTVPETYIRLAEIVAMIENPAADDPSLDEFAGVVGAELTSHRAQVTVTPDGPIGWAEAVVTIETRLH